MVSPKAVKEAGDKFVQKPICAGPFKYVERVTQERIVLERFADYWDKDRIHLDRITYLPIPDSTVRLANLRAGALDLIERISPTDIPAVRSDPKLKLLLPRPPIAYTGLTINLANTDRAKNPLGQNAKVRHALELTIDRDAINQVVFDGDFTPGNQWSAPSNQYYVQKFPIPKRNVEKAKALIKEAGVADADHARTDGAKPAGREAGGGGASGDGGRSRLRPENPPDRVHDVAREAVKGNFQIYLIGWSGRVDPDQNVINHLGCGAARSTGENTATRPRRPASNEARTVSEPAKRKAAYEKALTQIEADKPLIYLYHQHWVFAYSAKLEGYKQPPDGIIRPQDIKLAR